VLISIIPPHQQGEWFDYTDKLKTVNIYKFSSEFLQTEFRPLLSFYDTEFDKNCYYELILGMLIYMRRGVFHCQNVHGIKWIEVDNPHDLRRAEVLFAEDGGLDATEAAFGGFWGRGLLDFSYIRNMRFPTAAMVEEIRAALPELLRSYGSSQSVLDEKMSDFLDLPRQRVCALNGASQIFPLWAERLGQRRVAIPEPSFGEYERCFSKTAVYRDDFISDIEEVTAQGIGDADVVVFVNPNIPTGSTIPPRQIFDFARSSPDKLVLIDESFADFTTMTSVQSMLSAEPLDNVWLLKSLSKSLGAPGARLGYLFAPEDEISWVRSKLPIWNMNAIAEFVLELATRHKRALEISLKQTLDDRSELSNLLQKVEGVVQVYPSGADFLAVRIDLERAAVRRLKQVLFNRHRILLRDISARMQDGATYLRIAVRLPDENRYLADSLGEALRACRD
jgi:histidinol-phosphate/aromatic aminotransferase/cobyric acid decarboxylase-like protein